MFGRAVLLDACKVQLTGFANELVFIAVVDPVATAGFARAIDVSGRARLAADSLFGPSEALDKAPVKTQPYLLHLEHDHLSFAHGHPASHPRESSMSPLLWSSPAALTYMGAKCNPSGAVAGQRRHCPKWFGQLAAGGFQGSR
ncbi:hypothetical protein FHR86_003754 [Paenarthrobacter ilicis]|uniref:Uncharacterized protein n=1 Tax=Paenarthrobacter ilicis TaxID=43665 RepID=A0ABX0TNH4_9MICC|nr:hypothetical protein [Paenarthrobacter ilicis]NIJ03395.1 hypothetical protein [Paenarthrobacter ilicis]